MCSLRLDLCYFLGYNLDEALPWHSTLSRTKQLFSKDLFENLFTHILSLCVDSGMIAGSTRAIDLAYIKAKFIGKAAEPPQIQVIADASPNAILPAAELLWRHVFYGT